MTNEFTLASGRVLKLRRPPISKIALITEMSGPLTKFEAQGRQIPASLSMGYAGALLGILAEDPDLGKIAFPDRDPDSFEYRLADLYDYGSAILDYAYEHWDLTLEDATRMFAEMPKFIKGLGDEAKGKS